MKRETETRWARVPLATFILSALVWLLLLSLLVW
jgi:hypothetical protein